MSDVTTSPRASAVWRNLDGEPAIHGDDLRDFLWLLHEPRLSIRASGYMGTHGGRAEITIDGQRVAHSRLLAFAAAVRSGAAWTPDADTPAGWVPRDLGDVWGLAAFAVPGLGRDAWRFVETPRDSYRQPTLEADVDGLKIWSGFGYGGRPGYSFYVSGHGLNWGVDWEDGIWCALCATNKIREQIDKYLATPHRTARTARRVEAVRALGEVWAPWYPDARLPRDFWNWYGTADTRSEIGTPCALYGPPSALDDGGLW